MERSELRKNLPAVWVSFSVDDFDGSKRALARRFPTSYLFLRPMRLTRFDKLLTPEAVSDGLKIVSKMGFFGAYANGFTHISDGFLETSPTVDALSARQDLSSSEYARFAMEWISQGPQLLADVAKLVLHISKSWPNRLKSWTHNYLGSL